MNTGVILALLSAFGFSMKAIWVKLAYGFAVSAVIFMVYRMLLSLPFFLWLGLREKREPLLSGIAQKDWLWLILLGFLGYYLSSYLDFLGLEYISAGLERLILFTYPLLTMLLNQWLHKRSIHRMEWASLALCYAGITLAFFHDVSISQDIHQTLMGCALVLGSAFAFALYLAISPTIIHRVGSSRFTTLVMVFSTIIILVHFVAVSIVSGDSIGNFSTLIQQPWQVFALGVAIAIISTAFPVWAQTEAIARIGSNQAVLIGTIGPIFTIFFSYWLLSEPISLQQMLGMAMVIGGVFLAGKINYSRPPQ